MGEENGDRHRRLSTRRAAHGLLLSKEMYRLEAEVNVRGVLILLSATD